jgi:hypothetical protein
MEAHPASTGVNTYAKRNGDADSAFLARDTGI